MDYLTVFSPKGGGAPSCRSYGWHVKAKFLIFGCFLPHLTILEKLIRSMKFLSLDVALYLYKSYTHVWNTVLTCGLVPLVATWNC